MVRQDEKDCRKQSHLVDKQIISLGNPFISNVTA